jgi:hypothetical protein
LFQNLNGISPREPGGGFWPLRLVMDLAILDATSPADGVAKEALV